jgi:hypothetical protein
MNAEALHCPACGGDPGLPVDEARLDLERRSCRQPWLAGAGSSIGSAVETGMSADASWAIGTGGGYLLLLGLGAVLANIAPSFEDLFFTAFLWSPVASLVCAVLAILGARRPPDTGLALALQVLSFLVSAAVFLVALCALFLLYTIVTWE